MPRDACVHRPISLPSYKAPKCHFTDQQPSHELNTHYVTSALHSSLPLFAARSRRCICPRADSSTRAPRPTQLAPTHLSSICHIQRAQGRTPRSNACKMAEKIIQIRFFLVFGKLQHAPALREIEHDGAHRERRGSDWRFGPTRSHVNSAPRGAQQQLGPGTPVGETPRTSKPRPVTRAR